jgi:hypothetical protein
MIESVVRLYTKMAVQVTIEKSQSSELNTEIYPTVLIPYYVDSVICDHLCEFQC